MANSARSDANEMRVVYWGPPTVSTMELFDSIAESLAPSENCRRTRFPTSIDPTSWYEELSVFLRLPAGTRSRLKLVSTPSPPDLAPSRLQLLDGADAMVIVVDPTSDHEEEILASLMELEAALAAYGRAPRDLSIVVQYTRDGRETDSTTIMNPLAKFEIFPASVHEVSPERPITFREPLESLLRALRRGRDEATGSLSATVDLEHTHSDPQSPRTVTHHSAASENEPAISAMLEASILAESEATDGPSDTIDLFFESPAATGPEDPPRTSFDRDDQKDFGLAWTGATSQTSNRRVRIPLALTRPGGEPIPLTLHIELEETQEDNQES